MIQQGLFDLTGKTGGAARAEGYTLTYRSHAEVRAQRGRHSWTVFGYGGALFGGVSWDVSALPDDVRPAVASLLAAEVKCERWRHNHCRQVQGAS